MLSTGNLGGHSVNAQNIRPNVNFQVSELIFAYLLSAYEIEVKTSGKQEAGTIHNGWIILEGKRETSKTFRLENSAANKILRK